MVTKQHASEFRPDGASNYVYLSYSQSSHTPTSAKWLAPPRIEPIQRIAQGDVSNLSRICMYNHCGSHIDSPNHFDDHGRPLAHFSPEEFFFNSPVLYRLPLEDLGLITAQDLAVTTAKNVVGDASSVDLVFIETGFSRFREHDPERYRWSCPGVSADAIQWLVDSYPQMRALALDFVSLEWTVDDSHGFSAHKCAAQHDLMIIEDLNLSFITEKEVAWVAAIPLIFEELDSSPATIIARLKDEGEDCHE